jgi:hypothetical protein
MDGGFVGLGVPITYARAVAIEVDAADVVDVSEHQPTFVAPTTANPHLVGARDACADVAGGLANETKRA